MTPSIKIPREVVEKVHAALDSCDAHHDFGPCFDWNKIQEAIALLAPYLKGE